MKSTKFTLMVLGIVFSCFTFSEAARAEGARSYITPSGSDNRACTRTQPCRTFDGAIAKTDEGGEIIALETGTYEPTTVTKSITLTAAPGADAIIKSNAGNGVTISPPVGAMVVLRGLKISGPGKTSNTKGVALDLGQNSSVTIFVENCLISDFGVGINAVVNTSAQVVVHDSVIRNNTSGMVVHIGGVELMGVAVIRSRFERNNVGLVAQSGNSVDVKDSVADSNGIGFRSEFAGNLSLFNCIATRNQTGVDVDVSGLANIAYSMFSGNSVGVAAQGSVRTMGNNMFTSNDVDITGTPNVTVLTPR